MNDSEIKFWILGIFFVKMLKNFLDSIKPAYRGYVHIKYNLL